MRLENLLVSIIIRFQALVTIAMLYNIVSSVLRLTFVEFEEQHKFIIFTLDSICDIIYLSDFAVKFRTGYLDDGILVCYIFECSIME